MSGKDGVKTLFLISNYFCGVGIGLSFFAMGLGNGLMYEMSSPFIAMIVVGLAVFLNSLIGHCAAIKDNRKLLDTYAFLMVIFAINEVRQLIMLRCYVSPDSKVPDSVRYEKYFIFSIFATTLTIFSIFLTSGLSVQLREKEKASNPSRPSIP